MSADQADFVFEHLYNLVTQLGLPINVNKLVPPTTVMTCMGIEVDAHNKTV